MKIRDYFKRGKRTFTQKDITLNHCYRLGLASDNKTHQLHYMGDMTSAINLEDELDDTKKLQVHSFFEKYLENTSNASIQLEMIFLKSYGKLEVGYKVFANDLVIFGFNEGELLTLVFCEQSKRSKTIFGAFKATRMNYHINRANQIWRLICEY